MDTNLTKQESRGFYKLSWLQRIGFGSGDLAQNLIYQTIGMYLLLFYTNVFGIDPATVAVMFLTVLFFEVNLPISLCLAWLTNPFTLVPILYLGFWLGAKVFQVNMIDQDMMLGVLHQISHWISHFGHGHIDFSLAKILLSGLVLEAFIFALILFVMTRLFWQWSIIQHYKRRRYIQSSSKL